MYVVKRDGRKEAVKFDKITARIVKMCYGLDPLVSPEAVAMKVIEGLFALTRTGFNWSPSKRPSIFVPFTDDLTTGLSFSPSKNISLMASCFLLP